MTIKTLHPDLEAHVAGLRDRITTLKNKISHDSEAERVEDLGRLTVLEQHHHALAEKLRALNQEGPGFRQTVKAEILVLAEDLHRLLESLSLRHHSG
jgi:predicted  nucleic acid-binding Zn-ribbon protein